MAHPLVQRLKSFENFLDYPKNLVKYDGSEHDLSAYSAYLKHREKAVFGGEDSSALGLLDLYDGDKGRLSRSCGSTCTDS